MPKPVVTIHQPSMTEWFAAIGEIEESNAFREEDNRKVDRSEILYQTIGVPYERPEEFEAVDAFTPSPAFQSLLDTRGDELCALRLVPKTPELPKVRQRGLSIKQTYQDWLLKQEIDPKNYTLYVCPHSDVMDWSAIFVVHHDGIFGEIIRGLPMQLTQGVTSSTCYRFQYDFSEWSWSEYDEEAQKVAERMLGLITVPDAGKQNELSEKLNSTFTHDILEGYFEATLWPNGKMYIIDYNRLLPKYLPIPPKTSSDQTTQTTFSGSIAFPGVVRGIARIVDQDCLDTAAFSDGDILVTHNTDVRFLPFMRQAGAIVTNLGGILSHAAIIARELKKPCIIGTKVATQTVKDGDMIEVDADQGLIRLMK